MEVAEDRQAKGRGWWECRGGAAATAEEEKGGDDEEEGGGDGGGELRIHGGEGEEER